MNAARAPLTALRAGLASCHVCGQLARLPAAGGHHARCPRCGAPMHARKPASIATTWALVLASILLYLPANLLPMMVTASFLGSQEDTILSGVIFLWESGSWPLAVVVFFASVMVPLLKILALLYLLITVQRRSRSEPAATCSSQRVLPRHSVACVPPPSSAKRASIHWQNS